MEWTAQSLVWVLLWIAGGSVYVFLVRRGINYIDHFYVTALYFAGASLLVGLPFREQLLPVLRLLKPFHGGLFLAVLAGQILVHGISRRFLLRPVGTIRAYPHIYWLRMDYRYLVSKPFELLFQQTMILILVLMLREKGLDFPLLSFVFVGIFALLHIPIIPLVGRFFGVYYLVWAAVAAFVFPWLILRFPDGFLYTYLLHWAFYLSSAVYFWLNPLR